MLKIRDDEIFIDISGYEGLYQVSNLGRIKRLDKILTINDYKKNRIYNRKEKGAIIKPFLDNNGYLTVTLSKEGKCNSRKIHRLVAEMFISNPKKLPQVNHKDGNKYNNKVENLEWCSCKENILHAWKNGLTTVNKNAKKIGKERNRKRKIKQYDIKDNFIKEWESAAEAGRQLNILRQTISNACRGKQKTAGGYVWRYKQ